MKEGVLMRYEDCPACVKRDVLEFNIDMWSNLFFMFWNLNIDVLNTLMSEYIALCPFT